MNLYFEHNFQDQFRNFIDYPYQEAKGKRVKAKRPPSPRPYNPLNPRSFCGCGFAADGEDIPEDLPKVSNEVSKLQAWTYLRTALMVIGAYVAVTWAYKKLAK